MKESKKLIANSYIHCSPFQNNLSIIDRKRPKEENNYSSDDVIFPIFGKNKSIRTQIKQNATNSKSRCIVSKSTLSDKDSVDDYSFRKLREKILSFEELQKEHSTKITSKSNKVNKASHNTISHISYNSKYAISTKKLGDLKNNIPHVKNISLKKAKYALESSYKSSKDNIPSYSRENDKCIISDLECKNVIGHQKVNKTVESESKNHILTPSKYCYSSIAATPKPQCIPTLKQKNTVLSKSNQTKISTKKYNFISRMREEDIQATDNANASVEKLAQWLINDPFHKQKPLVIRKGNNIIQKSRIFEKDMSNIIVKERDNFRPGTVSQGKIWLMNAFNNNRKEPSDRIEVSLSVMKKKEKLESLLSK